MQVPHVRWAKHNKKLNKLINKNLKKNTCVIKYLPIRQRKKQKNGTVKFERRSGIANNNSRNICQF